MTFWSEDELNEEQEAAVLEEQSVFLTACPGSGKTHALTYKIAYELSRIETKKQFVVAITYTHRAADEIHERVESLGLDVSQLWIGTIHAFCLEWILKPYSIYHESLKHGFRVIDSHEQEKLLTQLCAPHRKQGITYWECGFYFTEEGYHLSCKDGSKHKVVHSVLRQYFEAMQVNRQIDFELILFYAAQLLKSHQPISELLSKLFPLILIDEYQDTKQIQYQIVASIIRASQGATRVFIVGDPNQAIYGSLGGYPIERKDFEGMAKTRLKPLSLTKNYRSSEKLIRYFSNYNVHATVVEPASKDRNYQSIISFDDAVHKASLGDQIARLIKMSVDDFGFHQSEICIVAPQWVHLASMTRHLVVNLPQYEFDGPGMVPFARDIENFWYQLARIALTEASPSMYVRRLRWATEVLKEMDGAGISVASITNKKLLRECNLITINESDGLLYLQLFFEKLFENLQIDFHLYPLLNEHFAAFFESSQARIARIQKEGVDFISDISTFRKVFQQRTGITVSTIHGVKGAEFDVVIAFALLDGMVPHFNDDDVHSADRLLYVIGSRARKNLHLISERGRTFGRYGNEYPPTAKLAGCVYKYDLIK